MELNSSNFNAENFTNVMSELGFADGFGHSMDMSGYSWTNQYQAIEDLVDVDEAKQALHAFPELSITDSCNNGKLVAFPYFYSPGSSSSWFTISYKVYVLNGNVVQQEIGTCVFNIYDNDIDDFYFSSNSGGGPK